MVKREIVKENGNKWAEVEYIAPEGVRVRVYREIRARADLNRERAKPLVSRSHRRQLEKHEYLDKQGHPGLFNETGRFLLNAERRRGPGKVPKEPPKWWILDELWKLYRRRNPWETLEGSRWKWIASEVTWRARVEGSKAKDESWLGENETLGVDDVKNTWRETGLKWTDPR